MPMFRNLTFDDLKKLAEIDSYNYLLHPHFISELPPEVSYYNESESIKTKQDQQRISETIRAYKMRANK